MDKQYFAPTTLPELYQALGAMPEGGKIVSGGTDLILQLRAGKVCPTALLYLGELPEARGITREAGRIRIGAMCDMTTLANSTLLAGSCGAVVHAAAHVGSVQIRNKATIGGNVANASPAGDLLPPLWLLGADALVAGPGGLRSLPMDELVTGVSKTALSPREAIVAFTFPEPAAHVCTAYRKLGSRSEVTISRVGLAVWLEREGARVTRADLMLGAVATTPVRAHTAEQELLGSSLEPEAVERAGKALTAYILEINNRPNRFYKARATRGVLADLLAGL